MFGTHESVASRAVRACMVALVLSYALRFGVLFTLGMGLWGASGCAMANAPESNELPNGRCRNPSDATTTIECKERPPPIAGATAPSPVAASSTADEGDSARRAEVLARIRAGSEVEAAALFWNLPQSDRTTNFAATITTARVERVRALESNPRDVAQAVRGLTLDALPGDSETLRALAGRIAKALGKLSRYGAATSADFRLGATMVQVVRGHPAEMGDASAEAFTAFEERYGSLLAAAQINDESDWQTFIKLFPHSKYATELEDHIGQLDRLAVASASAKRQDEQADQLWEAVRTQGDNLAQLSFKIGLAEKQFDPRRARRGVQNMKLHRQMLIKDGYCPARQGFVGALGVREFDRRAAQHCKDEPPTEGGLAGVEVKLAAECRAAFATGC